MLLQRTILLEIHMSAEAICLLGNNSSAALEAGAGGAHLNGFSRRVMFEVVVIDFTIPNSIGTVLGFCRRGGFIFDRYKPV